MNKSERLLQFVFIEMLMVYMMLDKEIDDECEAVYDITAYPGMVQLTNLLRNELNDIQRECIDHTDKISQSDIQIERIDGEWMGDDKFEEKVKKLREKNQWVKGWTGDSRWINYSILYDGEFMNDAEALFPHLYRSLYNFKDALKVVALSVLHGRSSIPEHTDPFSSPKHGSLTYHFNIDVPGDCFLSMKTGDKTYTVVQETGGHIIFDPSYVHSVVNNSDKIRTILYCDFSIDKIKDFILCQVINIEKNKMDVLLLFTDDTYHGREICNDSNGDGVIYFLGGKEGYHHVIFNEPIEDITKYMGIRLR